MITLTLTRKSLHPQPPNCTGDFMNSTHQIHIEIRSQRSRSLWPIGPHSGVWRSFERRAFFHIYNQWHLLGHFLRSGIIYDRTSGLSLRNTAHYRNRVNSKHILFHYWKCSKKVLADYSSNSVGKVWLPSLKRTVDPVFMLPIKNMACVL